MTVADCDRDLWRSGRRQCPSHDIDCEYRVDLRSACSPPFAVPGIGESAGGEAAQCFDPLTTRGFTRVARGRYPIWGCSGLQQHTRLPSRSRACREQGYTIDRGKDYRVEKGGSPPPSPTQTHLMRRGYLEQGQPETQGSQRTGPP